MDQGPRAARPPTHKLGSHRPAAHPGDHYRLNFKKNVAQNLAGIELDEMSDSEQVEKPEIGQLDFKQGGKPEEGGETLRLDAIAPHETSTCIVVTSARRTPRIMSPTQTAAGIPAVSERSQPPGLVLSAVEQLPVAPVQHGPNHIPHSIENQNTQANQHPGDVSITDPDAGTQQASAQRMLLLKSLVRFVSVLSLEHGLLVLGVTAGRLAGMGLLRRVLVGLLTPVLFDNGYKAWLLWEGWSEEGGAVRRKLLIIGLLKGLLLGVFLVITALIRCLV